MPLHCGVGTRSPTCTSEELGTASGLVFPQPKPGSPFTILLGPGLGAKWRNNDVFILHTYTHMCTRIHTCTHAHAHAHAHTHAHTHTHTHTRQVPDPGIYNLLVMLRTGYELQVEGGRVTECSGLFMTQLHLQVINDH